MDLFIRIAISIGVGWFVWKIGGPKVQTVLIWTNGELSVQGQISPHQKQEIQEFFGSHFSDVARLRVRILVPSRSQPVRSRIQIRGITAPDQLQLIRNFLVSRLT